MKQSAKAASGRSSPPQFSVKPLLDLFLDLPLLDTGRAEAMLGWWPRRTGVEALAELLHGMRHGGSFPTAPLDDDSTGRADELRTTVGGHLGP